MIKTISIIVMIGLLIIVIVRPFLEIYSLFYERDLAGVPKKTKKKLRAIENFRDEQEQVLALRELLPHHEGLPYYDTLHKEALRILERTKVVQQRKERGYRR